MRKEGRMKKSRTPILDTFRKIEVYRPKTPQIDRWIDREFKVIYINTAAAPGAKITYLK